SPAGKWTDIQRDGALVDPSLLTAIGAHVGDTIGLGDARFRIIGTVVNVPGDIGLQSAFGARVFIATSAVPATHLLTLGARAQYETYLQLPATINSQRVARIARPTLRS